MEIERVPGYRYEYDEELEETKKVVEFRIVQKSWCSWFDRVIVHSIEDGPETVEEFMEWLKYPIPKTTAKEIAEKEEWKIQRTF